MSVMKRTLMRMFGRPRGALGRLGGVIMARSNAAIARSVISLLDVHPGDQVLEVGFGPGVGIQLRRGPHRGRGAAQSGARSRPDRERRRLCGPEAYQPRTCAQY